jgi:hypothetical protein
MHFSDGNCGKLVGKKLPDLSEKYIMGLDLAGDLLYWTITPQEITEKWNSWSFKLVPSTVVEKNGASTCIREACQRLELDANGYAQVGEGFLPAFVHQ